MLQTTISQLLSSYSENEKSLKNELSTEIGLEYITTKLFFDKLFVCYEFLSFCTAVSWQNEQLILIESILSKEQLSKYLIGVTDRFNDALISAAYAESLNASLSFDERYDHYQLFMRKLKLLQKYNAILPNKALHTSAKLQNLISEMRHLIGTLNINIDNTADSTYQYTQKAIKENKAHTLYVASIF